MGQALGVLTGCDREQEWLLFDWFDHFRKHNPGLPVAFGDLGMSKEGKKWCKSRGLLIPASQIPLLPPQKSKETGWPYGKERWLQKNLAAVFSSSQRSILFRKPLLMKQSPFQRTLYLDPDCQVLRSLSPLFSIRLGSMKMALRSCNDFFEMKSIGTNKSMFIRSYNSGVALFEKNSPLLNFWISLLPGKIDSFNNDDRLLSFAIAKYGMPATRLALKYNWIYYWGPNPGAVIYHWIGEAGKLVFRFGCGDKNSLHF